MQRLLRDGARAERTLFRDLAMPMGGPSRIAPSGRASERPTASAFTVGWNAFTLISGDGGGRAYRGKGQIWGGGCMGNCG
jgi:hypothetical protein